MNLLKSAATALLLALTTLVCAAPAAAQTVEYVHTDALGSVVAVTDANRNIVERREYEPYGYQLTPTLQNGPGYTGHVQDASTGLTYMQQRYYDPLLGRFLSVDPVTMHDNGDPRLFNRYGYANNSPYTYSDPDGRQASERFVEQHRRDMAAGNGAIYEPMHVPAAVATAAMLVGPVAIAAGPSVTAAVLANGPRIQQAGAAIAEVAAGDALGGASLGTGLALTAGQAANLARFERKLPAGHTDVAVDELGEAVAFTASVPGRVPGSEAVYQKVVDAVGETMSYLKTTFTPNGDVVHIKDKLNPPAELPKY